MIKTIEKQKFILLTIISFALMFVVSFSACTQNSTSTCSSIDEGNTNAEVVGFKHYDGYELQQMTVLSRHNIRSPYTGEGSTLNKLTPHTWFDWTAPSTELSLKGGQLETIMGQYFRKFLEQEHFIPENWVPEADQAYFYANCLQRTISTAQYFSTGMLPLANAKIVTKYPLNGKDATFFPLISKSSNEFKNQVMSEIEQFGGDKGLNGILEGISGELKTLENTLDFKESSYAKENNITSLPLDDISVNITTGEEISTKGTLKLGFTASDALKLQFYEETDDAKAAFGKKLSISQWEEIGKIYDVYDHTIHGSHTAAVDAANPMLKEIKSDMSNSNRKFTFLCGHDSTISSLLTALNTEDYSLPNTISKKTPIGGKLVFNKYTDQAGELYCTISLCYQTLDQLRTKTSLDCNKTPMVYQLSLKGLDKNNNGMYKYSDVVKRIDDSIAENDKYQ